MIKSSASGLPYANASPGYLYVIRFSDDVIKVGRASENRLSARISTHRNRARRFGVLIEDVWTSELVQDHEGAERAMLHKMRSSGIPLSPSSEHFVGVSFDDAVSLVSRVVYRWLLIDQQSYA